MSTPEPGSLPATRTLPLVLRRLLDVGGVSLLVGKVMAIPDGKHVDVEIAGQRVVIPGLAGYVPVVGEGCWCLVGSSIVLAIGSASGTRPTTVPSGTAEGQVLAWNASLAQWQGRAKAPDADALDGIDSSGFLRTLIGSGRCWYTKYAGTTDGFGQVVVAHGLGVVPAVALVTPLTVALVPVVVEASLSASTVTVRYFDFDSANPSGVAVRGSLFVAA